jgi:DNA mismatch repair protein MutS2
MAAAPVAFSTGETGGVRSEARAALDRVEERLRADTPEAPAAAVTTGPAPGTAPGVRPEPGARVAVGPLGLEGVVQAVYEREAEVNVRGKRLRASFEELRVLGGGAPTAPRVSVSVQVQARDSAVTDLNVIGCSVDEAVTRADKFLDEAAVSEQKVVRLIHGHGTGQLRRALAEFLQGHPLVARIGPAPPEQGGSGVTVVEMKE